MKLKCDYCGNTYEDTLHQCPDCGAPNPSHKNDKGPKTIEELKIWYKNRNLPDPEVTRFFIGVDYKKPKAFGIYKDDNGEFVVYKNKADGSRAVRYRGSDEEYAVNELLQRLKDEIVHQKASSGFKSDSATKSSFSKMDEEEKSIRKNRGNGGYDGRKTFFLSKLLALFFIILVLILILKDANFNSHKGYYRYDDDVYYCISDDWYHYDGGWTEVSSTAPGPVAISANYDEYFISKSWDPSIETTNWNNSSYYDRYHTSNSSSDDNDSDYDWDSNDSWDSGNTDWGSDW